MTFLGIVVTKKLEVFVDPSKFYFILITFLLLSGFSRHIAEGTSNCEYFPMVLLAF